MVDLNHVPSMSRFKHKTTKNMMKKETNEYREGTERRVTNLGGVRSIASYEGVLGSMQPLSREGGDYLYCGACGTLPRASGDAVDPGAGRRTTRCGSLCSYCSTVGVCCCSGFGGDGDGGGRGEGTHTTHHRTRP